MAYLVISKRALRHLVHINTRYELFVTHATPQCMLLIARYSFVSWGDKYILEPKRVTHVWFSFIPRLSDFVCFAVNMNCLQLVLDARNLYSLVPTHIDYISTTLSDLKHPFACFRNSSIPHTQMTLPARPRSVYPQK